MKPSLPAEWAPQAFVQLTWPRREGDFSRWFGEVEANFIRIAVAIGQFQPVLIACPDDADALHRRLLAEGIPPEHLSVLPVRANDVWARDHGPITILRGSTPTHLDFQFNGWGGKFDADLDNTVTQQLAELGALPGRIDTLDFVLEGGAIESDGLGTLLTTERCLLAATRNPKLGRGTIEQKLAHWLGLSRILWLKHGDLLGDDTDGHVDTIARFCTPDTIAYQACDDEADPHFALLQPMADELRALKKADGTRYTLIPLPLPRAHFDEEGQRLPAGYANFLIVNGAVLVPTYDDPVNDPIALERLRPAFPEREVIGVDCCALIRQFGSLHCVTMQVPR
ncbi:agmatine deiminase family protein [Polycyclovorans algicola]|uniref:agmatine deiminase family protein n=1 Tax=Polycyclovorans algicola TaxID=616992 RepID=UPI0004A743D3|nr:agmatine deiminase family protein [Polycyclovorans algicola]